MRLLSLLSHTHALPTYAAPHRAFRAFSPTMVEVEEPEEPPPPGWHQQLNNNQWPSLASSQRVESTDKPFLHQQQPYNAYSSGRVR